MLFRSLLIFATFVIPALGVAVGLGPPPCIPQRISERCLWSRGEWASRLMARLSVLSPRSLKERLEPDLSDMDKFLEKLGPLNGQGRELPRLPRDPVGMWQQLQEELEEVRARLEPYMAEVHERVD